MTMDYLLRVGGYAELCGMCFDVKKSGRTRTDGWCIGRDDDAEVCLHKVLTLKYPLKYFCEWLKCVYLYILVLCSMTPYKLA